jgi:cob(I)alamin adenosyltransferase
VKAKIYTKTGDRGQTSLVGGTRVFKTDQRLEAYGTLDELNSLLGVVLSQLDKIDAIAERLRSVQNNLFNIGSHLACEDDQLRKTLPHLSSDAIGELERDMDTWEAQLPALRNFILPGGSRLAAHTHLARTVCRRAERATVSLGASVAEDHMIYLNRLSDWLFLLARFFNHRLQIADVPWQKG